MPGVARQMTAASHARTIVERHEDQGLAFESTIESDCAPVASLVLELLEAGFDLRCL